MILLIGLFLFFIYMLPGILSTYHSTSNNVSVMLINIFFGWTIFGWIIALILAMKGLSSKQFLKGILFVLFAFFTAMIVFAIQVNKSIQ